MIWLLPASPASSSHHCPFVARLALPQQLSSCQLLNLSAFAQAVLVLRIPSPLPVLSSGAPSSGMSPWLSKDTSPVLDPHNVVLFFPSVCKFIFFISCYFLFPFGVSYMGSGIVSASNSPGIPIAVHGAGHVGVVPTCM